MSFTHNITSSVAKASVILTFLGIISKGIGFFREIIYANNFGLSQEFDIFLTAIAIPSAINTAVTYLVQHYFIPLYNKTKKESEEKSVLFFNYNFWWFIIGGIVLSAILYIFSQLILSPYMSSLPSNFQETGIKIFYLFLFTVPLNAGMAVIIAYLQANFKFIYPAFSLITLNTIVVVIVLFFTNLLQIFVLPFGFLVAYIIAFTILLHSIRSKLKFIPSNILKNNYRISDINILISLVFIEGTSLSYIIVDRYFVGNVTVGGIAALNYAFVIFSLPISLFSLPLITTTFSKFSKTIANLSETLENEIQNTLSVNYYIIVPCIFLLFFWGDIFLEFFYERGKFTALSTNLTYSVLKYYSPGLLFITTYYLLVKILYSINKYTQVLKISVIAFLLKIFFNYMFVENLEQNGLALSTSVIYLFLFLSGSFFVVWNNKSNYKIIFTGIIYYIINGIMSYLIVFFLFDIIAFNNVTSNFLKLLFFIIIYILNSFIMKEYAFNIIKKTIKGFIGKQ